MLHLLHLNQPDCLPDGVCSAVAVDGVAESLAEGFCGEVAVVMECSSFPFGVLEFALVWALWHSRCSSTRVALCTHPMRDYSGYIFLLYSIAHSIWTVGSNMYIFTPDYTFNSDSMW